MEPDILVRNWIVEVLRAHQAVVAIAIRQRAKFEGWLKFELAARAERNGMQDVRVEAATEDSTRGRGDLTFSYSGQRCDVEVKTCNTNWRMKGVLDSTRPITKNVAAVIKDARKLQTCTGYGVIAVCMFPVGCNDMRWTQYLARIGEATGVPLSVERHSTRVSVPFGHDCEADVVVFSFLAAKSDMKRIAAAAQAL